MFFWRVAAPEKVEPNPIGTTMNTTSPSIRGLLAVLVISGLLFPTGLFAAAGPPRPLWAPAATDVTMLPGVAAVTCAAQKEDASGAPVPPECSFPMGYFDLRTPNAADYQPFSSPSIWNPDMWHHADWSVKNI